MTFPLMPMNPATVIPNFSATLKYAAGVSNGSTLDVASYVTNSFSTIMAIQLYAAPGGGETFYYPPTTKMNGADMPLIASVYTNALDDGFAWSISTLSVPKGSAATLTWTCASSAVGAVYEVQGFTNMAASVHAIASSVVLGSGNNRAPRNTTVSTTSRSKVLYVTIGALTGGVDMSGKMDQFNNVSSWEIGFDWSPATPSETYYGGDRGTTVVAFNTNY